MDHEADLEKVSSHSSNSGRHARGGRYPQVFINAEDMKRKVRETLTKPQYCVFDFYHETGFWQKIARSSKFENITLGVIGLNALWISIDTDHNGAEMLLDAHPVFQIAEHLFCAYFTAEWFTRFMSFKRKCNGLKDGWFVFDSSLVFMMVAETWVMTLVIVISGGGGGGMGNASILRLVRLLRLSRMARMARLLRAMPELMIMIKGMVAAMRSVFFTIALLFISMYVFAIAFTQLTADTDVGKKYFNTVPESIYTLLLSGTLLDNIGVVLTEIGSQSVVVAGLLLLFVLLGALTIMNMLIGVLCEVVSAVAQVEREEMAVGFVNDKMSGIMHQLDQDGDELISKEEFKQILDQPEAIKALKEVDVDPVALVDIADFIFQEDNEDEDEDDGNLLQEKQLTFVDFMEVVLSLRGNNQATVKDVMDLRKFVRETTLRLRSHLDARLERIEELQEMMLGEEKLGGRRGNSRSSIRHRGSVHSRSLKHHSPTGDKPCQEAKFEGNFKTAEAKGPIVMQENDHVGSDAAAQLQKVVIEDCLAVSVQKVAGVVDSAEKLGCIEDPKTNAQPIEIDTAGNCGTESHVNARSRSRSPTSGEQELREPLPGKPPNELSSTSAQPNSTSISRQSTRECLPGSDKCRSPRCMGTGAQGCPEAAKGEIAMTRPSVSTTGTNASQQPDPFVLEVHQHMLRLETVLGCSIAEVSQILFALMTDSEKKESSLSNVPRASSASIALPGATDAVQLPTDTGGWQAAPQAPAGASIGAAAWTGLRSAANPLDGGGVAPQQHDAEAGGPSARLLGLDEKFSPSPDDATPAVPGKAKKPNRDSDLMKRVQALQRNLSNGLCELRAARFRSSRDHSEPPSSASAGSTEAAGSAAGSAGGGSFGGVRQFPSRVAGAAGATNGAQHAWPLPPGGTKPELLF